MNRILVAHLFHGVLLLAPSLLVAGPAGIGLASWAFASCIVFAAVVEGHFTRDSLPHNSVQDRIAIRVAGLVGVLLLMVFWAAQLEQLAGHGQPWMLCTVGFMLMVLGVTLRLLAIRALGNRFVSDIRVDGIVDGGIYAYLRHPSEIGLILIAIGGPLSLGSVISASAATLVLTPISLWRVRRENRALRNANCQATVVDAT